MVVVDNPRDFQKKNEEDIRRYLTNSKNIYDPELVNDIIQNFYVRLIKSEALKNYDPKRARFETYMLTILCRMLPHEKRKNPMARYSHVSAINYTEGGTARCAEDVDIFDFVYGLEEQTEFSVARKNRPSAVYQDEEDESIKHMIAFIAYVKKTETNKKKSDSMICFLERKMDGCLATDIANMLGVSDNMVKIMKNSIYDKYKKWDQPKAVSHV
jgi:DNA-directed RNA polymerase specialized sigma24 family protein